LSFLHHCIFSPDMLFCLYVMQLLVFGIQVNGNVIEQNL
jgi:hypothetical protein